MKTVVIVGGGSATFNLLKGLREFPTNNIIVVSTADNGGSTGTLRNDLGVMPWGDIRQCLVGLSYTAPALCNLFSYRFDRGSLKGHSAGNIILAALEKVMGSPEGAIAETARLLNVRGEVLFVSREPTMLSARLADGTLITGEHDIDEPITKRRSKIARLSLSSAEANPRALDALARADAIILGPGDLYTSTLPNLLVPGIADAIRRSRAKKILITNLMTKFGQTDGFAASDFLRVVNEYLGVEVIDIVILNTEKPTQSVLKLYKKEKAEFVAPDSQKLKESGVQVVERHLIGKTLHQKTNGDALKRSILKHDYKKTAELIWESIK